MQVCAHMCMGVLVDVEARWPEAKNRFEVIFLRGCLFPMGLYLLRALVL